MAVIDPNTALPCLLQILPHMAICREHGLTVDLHHVGNDITCAQGLQDFLNCDILGKIVVVNIHHTEAPGSLLNAAGNFHCPLERGNTVISQCGGTHTDL